MSYQLRDGKFDVVLVSGPRLNLWPSVGIGALSRICTQAGLSTGFFGGEHLRPRGVIPLPGTGGMVLIEDSQQRIHRIRARSVVRLMPVQELPDPFPGWRSPGLIPLSTAIRLREESGARWSPSTVILGTGNRALKFGSSLLESGVPQVYCVESRPLAGAKRYMGWEVERRRFEMLGGRVIEARPVGLVPKAAMLWELRLEDSKGVRLLEAQRVVSAGPFGEFSGVREYPEGSFIFDLEQSAPTERAHDVEGWMLEEERARMLAVRIARTLSVDLGERKQELDALYRRARSRIKKLGRHLEEPFVPAYEGKWLHALDARKVRSFSGTPTKELGTRAVASIECFEDIGCDLCQRACPEGAIELGKARDAVLNEDKCTACGLCLDVCPSASTLLIHAPEAQSVSRLTFSWRGEQGWKEGELATLLNRRGEALGSGRVVSVCAAQATEGHRVEVEVPSHLTWDARSIRRGRPGPAELDAPGSVLEDRMSEHVEVSLDGERRLFRDGIPLSIALFETGFARAEDVLLCRDGSCGLCEIKVDGIEKRACQIPVHRGMTIVTDRRERAPDPKAESGEARKPAGSLLCPCLGITPEQVIERVTQGNLSSAEAAISITRVGEGRCHGQVCSEPFRRLLHGAGVPVDNWADRRFPWTDWVLSPGTE